MADRVFLVLTPEVINARRAESLRSCEMELLSYDFERDHHEAAIAALGGIQWTAETLKYKGMNRDQTIARTLADGLSSTATQDVLALNQLEYHKLNLEAVKAETVKVERNYASIQLALPAGADRDAAIAATIAKVEAREAAAIAVGKG